MTIHKSQGQSLDSVIVITDYLDTAREAHTLFYVAVMRAKNSSKIRFLGDVYPKVLWQGLRKVDHQDFLREERRIHKSAQKHQQTLSDPRTESGILEAPLVPIRSNTLLDRACQYLRPNFNSRKWHKDIIAELPKNSRLNFDETVKNNLSLI